MSVKKFTMAALGGTLAGVILTTQVAGPMIAQEAAQTSNVYQQLDLFGDIFERIRAQYVEEVRQVGVLRDHATVRLDEVGVEEDIKTRNVRVDLAEQRGVSDVERFLRGNRRRVARDDLDVQHEAGAIHAACADAAFSRHDLRIRQRRDDACDRCEVAACAHAFQYLDDVGIGQRFRGVCGVTGQ